MNTIKVTEPRHRGIRLFLDIFDSSSYFRLNIRGKLCVIMCLFPLFQIHGNFDSLAEREHWFWFVRDGRRVQERRPCHGERPHRFARRRLCALTTPSRE